MSRQTRNNGKHVNKYCSRLCSNVVKDTHDNEILKETKGQEVERFSKKTSKRFKNVPFVKELFLGRFDKVKWQSPGIDPPPGD